MKAAHRIELLCRVLKVGRSSFYDWRHCRRRVPRNHDPLKVAIREAFHKSRGTYGYRRIYADLQPGAVRGSRRLILRLMKAMRLEAAPWKPSPYAAQKKAQEAVVCPHLLRREFSPQRPNQVWTGDITYIWTKTGWTYLAVVLDLYSRKVIGWSVSDTPDTALAQSALSQALACRSYLRGGLIFHSDQGCQYTSQAFQLYLTERGIRGSMSRRGQCWDNAPTESFFRTFKRETGIRRMQLEGKGHVEKVAVDWIETWYNLRRKHTFNGYRSPAEREVKWAA